MPDKKTSGLVDLGLITPNRRLTPVGESLLKMVKNNEFDINNILQLSADSFIYFKQLLKMCNVVDGCEVRPYIVVSYALNKLEYLTKDEFTYLMPLATTQDKLENIINAIIEIRNGKNSIDNIIISNLIAMSNYQAALNFFINNNVTEQVIMDIGMNRKSRSFDKPYFELFTALWDCVKNHKNEDVLKIYKAIQNINGKAGILWKQYIFNTSSRKKIEKCGISTLNIENELFNVLTEKDFKQIFFKLLHLNKAKSLLSDYFDLNKRYFKTSNTILFQDNLVKFDLLPKCYFNIMGDNLLKIAFKVSDNLEDDCDLKDISKFLNIKSNQLYNKVEDLYGIKVKSLSDAQNFIEKERYDRFNNLIRTSFTNENLINLLDLFENRTKENDEKIQELVTNNADIPTIFEYVLAIVWFKVSEMKGKILEFMNLSLDADLLPITHAAGYHEDITFKYEANNIYPEHTLLIEATLANGSNQRRMEMEPVSRHLGDQMLLNLDKKVYCLFASTYLHLNLISDFRNRKTYYYYNNDGTKSCFGMKIIPLATNELKKLLIDNTSYSQLYITFENAFKANIEPNKWYNDEIVAKI